MQKLILRYGLIATLVMITIGIINLTFLKSLSYELQEVAGYLTLFVAVLFVFFGIRKYRDLNGGNLRFVDGLKIGLLIVLIPAISFGLFDILYTEVIDPTWKETYYNRNFELIKSLPPDEYAVKKKQLEEQRAMFTSPGIQFLLMSSTVLILGLIVTVISSLALSRKTTNHS
jgi:hypothetical protein